MEPVRQISALSGFTAKQFAVLTPIITLAMVALCAAQLSWMGWVVGLPPAEIAFEFVHEAALPVSGGVALLGIIALGFAAIASFGGWCLSQPAGPPVVYGLLLWASRLLTSLIASLRRPSDFTEPICLPGTDGSTSVSPSRRIAVPNPAALAGASPLLE